MVSPEKKKKKSTVLFAVGKEKILANKYKILKKVGQGQISLVYKAINLNLNQVVAIKFPDVPEEDGEEIKQFVLEGAQTLARLSHPNIARVFDADTFKNMPYVVMEFIDGWGLEKMISPGHPMTLEEGFPIALSLAEALQYAHSKNVIHGDIKPKNIMLTRENRPVLVGFDLSSFTTEERQRHLQKLSQEHLAFLSPEIFSTGAGDPRTDIWSLGVTLFYMFTGVSPFGGFTPKEVIAKIQSTDYSPFVGIQLPSPLKGIFSKMIKRDPGARFASMIEVHKALSDFREQLSRSKSRLMVDTWTSNHQLNQALSAITGDTYEIIEKKGVGTFGIVYKARDKKLNRTVALKILKSEYLTNKEVLERFQREAQAISLIQHPNVVEIFSVGDLEGVPFFIMPFIEGEDLEKILSREIRLPLLAALKITLCIAQGLKAAHKVGVIHRDLKPANILMSKKLFPMITDFGVAYISHNKRLTQETSLMGTLLYMAPEQGKGARVDERTDLYSLGVVLYEMVTGSPPFVDDTPVGLIQKINNDPPTPFEDFGVQVPSAFKTFIWKLLEKEPESRHQNAQEVIADIKILLHQFTEKKE